VKMDILGIHAHRLAIPDVKIKMFPFDE
jgi:hypothetical protein